MPSIIARVLPKAQALSEGEMPDTVTIHTPGAETANEYGAMVPGAATSTTTDGRVVPLDANDVEVAVAGELRLDGLERLTVPLGTVIAGTATVTVVSARHGTTKNYTVEAVVPLSTFSVHRKVIVRAV